jgi:hypothetical protein
MHFKIQEKEFMMQPTSIQNDAFNFSANRITGQQEHQVNWFVYRRQAIRDQMVALWHDGNKITDFEKMTGASEDQLICQKINILFRSMENFGPNRNEFANYQYDRKNDAFHCHVWDRKYSYIVLWEADETRKIINIISMDVHENFTYKRVTAKKISMLAAKQAYDARQV